MAALVPLLLPAPSKPVAEDTGTGGRPGPAGPVSEPSAALDSAFDTAFDTPHYRVFGTTGSGVGAPLTSEPPLPETEPLTSESPFADAVPLTSESSPELTADVPEQGGPSFAVPEPTGT
ncbi:MULTISPECIES: hypothetical protein [unclassified Streptomyces]|uniref:hypothetical protein n=1 Tax=unclassified Streptomyces TaxID=2593676 RepID=UPI0022389087|nr:hypothetical protein [Streptomyces sp. SHP 1-2]MCW5251714.1 hypothetical protein [Streptomyces sp. SHP 1-2]